MDQKYILNLTAEIKQEDMKYLINSDHFEKELNRIIDNYSYDIIKKMVSTYFEEQKTTLETVLRDKVLGIINSLSSYNVFHEKGVFDNEPSYGTQVMNELILEMKPKIKERLKKTIEWAVNEKNANKIIKQTLHELIDAVVKVKE